MSFRLRRMMRVLSVLLVIVALAGTGCGRGLSIEEKQTRAELRQALREHAFEKAEGLAHRVVTAHPNENGAWQRLVHAQIGRRDFVSAKQSIAQWRGNVRKPSAKLEEFTGDIAAEEQDFASALSAWQRAHVANPKDARLLRKLARVQNAEHRWTEEATALTELLAREETGEDRMALALCFRRLRRWPEALDAFRRAHELAPDDPDVRRGAKLFERLSKFLAEIRELDARIAMPPADDQLLADRASLFLRAEDAELALVDAEAAASAAPWAVRPRIFQAIALQQLGRGEEAAKLLIDSGLRLDGLSSEFLQSVSRLDADIAAERSNAELYVARAWQLNDAGQPTLALQDAETALRCEPNSAGAHAESAYALAKLGRGDEAFERVKRATELDQNFSTAWHYRGELEMTRRNFVAAVDSLTRALAINQTPAALEKRETCYRQIGLLAKAEEDHRALESLNGRAWGR
ncbi:MAG: hypothetical protein H0U43_08060 [Chthoniobacterales bacterium]|nr:hypothetical protein [Chthoniobacterales bacterium]